MGPLAVGWVIAHAGCGGDYGEGGLGLRFSEASVLARTSSLAVQFYADEDSPDQCTRLRTARPRERAEVGPYRQALDDRSRQDGTIFPLTIPTGRWAVLVDATAIDGTLVGTGCAEDQVVLDRKRSSITLVVDAVTP